MNQRPGRNDPCSCGSGRKYKNCCEGKTRLFGQNVWSARTWIVLAIVGVGAVAFVLMRADRPREPASSTAPAGERPAPYTYDSQNNRHFDPVHGHWHEGPPPASAGTPAQGEIPASGSAPTAAPAPPAAAPSSPATPPEPWAYDAEKNQHWDPNHQHWHPGMPPAGR